VPLLAGLPADARDALAAELREVSLAAGQPLFREGDAGDAMYVVRSGRLAVEISSEGPEPVRLSGRSEVIGELALLSEAPRSATVRAVRDSALVELTREHFESLVAGRPEIGLALARELGERLRHSRSLREKQAKRPGTIALVPLDDAPLAEVAELLLAELRAGSRAIAIDGSEREIPADDDAVAASFGPLLDHAERDNDQVLLVARHPLDDPWTLFCLRQADRVVALGAGTRPPAEARSEPHLRGADVALVGEPLSAGRCTAWLDALDARAIHLVRRASHFGEDAGRLGRRLAGRSLGVVLSGGGARGFAHIGVLEELRRGGVRIDRIGGCSMGAYVGALYAMGLDPRAMHERCREEFVRRNPLGDYTVPRVALLRGAKGVSMLERTFGSLSIQELGHPYFCVSADLVTADLVVHRRGALAPAVGASMCLPAILPPRRRGERLLVDGGVLNNLPVEPMQADAEGPVIAVDVTGPFAVSTAPDAPLPGLKETLARAIAVGSVHAVDDARERAEVLVCPDVAEVGMLEWDALDRVVEAGRAAGREAVGAVTALSR
jgi:NTE family protein